jgi:Spy/CpxP family protein refolding chaperone
VENRIARLGVFLDLTENQKTAALKIFQANCANFEQRQNQSAELREKWQTAIKNGDGAQIDSLSQEWANLMAVRRATNAKAQAEFRRLLTPEQLVKLDAMNGAGFGMQGNRGGRRGMGGMNRAGQP